MHAATATAEVAATHMWNSAADDMRRSTSASASMASTAATSSLC
jgi:hypothetical protein